MSHAVCTFALPARVSVLPPSSLGSVLFLFPTGADETLSLPVGGNFALINLRIRRIALSQLGTLLEFPEQCVKLLDHSASCTRLRTPFASYLSPAAAAY